MGPHIQPLAQKESPCRSRRAVFERTRRMHAGTLNLFAVDEEAPPPAPVRETPRAHHNYESHDTREFSWPHLRRGGHKRREETPRGIHQVQNAAGKVQNIQVVGITDAYKDPSTMTPRRTGLRCLSRNSSICMSDILSYAGASECDGNSVRGSSSVPGSRCSSSGGGGRLRRHVEFTPQERFVQAVRDHAQRRRGGVTEFYVNLARGRVARRTLPTPSPFPSEWRLETGPVTHTLTLESCWDQLVSLTGIKITIEDLAQLLWDMEASHDENGTVLDEEQLRMRRVPYRDFSVAFGDNPVNNRLARMKI
ncbi:hypothetical protein TRVL_05275 [Trypanosoma vivax]|uniref:Uncharacterized protein n=1 Tax=Trypanosoma vivax (strain Y486) TaxID=1055687 RepID=G0UB47_TRYVY|nr:hypothetical protein TRVL_05275 [Trypanosoma vivax]CCC53034.1 conserved hypothetical protein [Trypanosoma vivax Y486]